MRYMRDRLLSFRNKNYRAFLAVFYANNIALPILCLTWIVVAADVGRQIAYENDRLLFTQIQDEHMRSVFSGKMGLH